MQEQQQLWAQCFLACGALNEDAVQHALCCTLTICGWTTRAWRVLLTRVTESCTPSDRSSLVWRAVCNCQVSKSNALIDQDTGALLPAVHHVSFAPKISSSEDSHQFPKVLHP